MNEVTAAESADQTATRRSLDVFDPSPDGVEPYTLAEVADAAGGVYESLLEFQAALLGCTTPLTLHPQNSQAERMVKQAVEWFETLDAVREIVERDLPLADSFPVVDGTVPEDREWTTGGHPLRLSEIIRLNAMAAERPLGQLTTYRREVESRDLVPGLIARRRFDAERAAAEDAVLHPGPDATPDQRKAAANAKRMKNRAANKAAKADLEATRAKEA